MLWDNSNKTEGDILKEYAISNGISDKDILVTEEVVNTEEEAAVVKKLINSNKKIILVTSAFHMFRAKKLLEKKDSKYTLIELILKRIQIII